MKSAVVLLFALSPSWLFQEPQAEPARVEVKMPVKVGAPGSTLKGKMIVTFAPGWHGYQNPPTNDYEIPLKIETKAPGFVLKVNYPKGEMKEFAGSKTAMYEGTVELPFVLKLPKKPGAVGIKFDVIYQQCNSSSCLPPESLFVTERLTIKKPAAKPPSKRNP
jgi:DsbC/DsbD-like thiol-disulfide interchange protein